MRSLPVCCAAAVALAGCYSDRLTANYNDVFEVSNSDDDSAIIDQSGRTEEDEARIRKRLMELEMEEEPAYHMNAGDQIEIRVYDHPDLGMTTRIGPDGMVGIAFMGQVKLSGQTIAQGAETVREGLAPYVKNPVVSITILE
ncbi:MAG: polysaccharide biosynthesis/export family protein, partial [Kiritimatiellae bacterium]|nr:polysaccharide biosynthesis/export family protein [Kiritimatiellia bacterium]